MTAKSTLRDLVDDLDEAEAALWLAAWQGDELAWTLLHAPVDDERETNEERQAAARGREALAQGRVKTSAQARRALWE